MSKFIYFTIFIFIPFLIMGQDHNFQINRASPEQMTTNFKVEKTPEIFTLKILEDDFFKKELNKVSASRFIIELPQYGESVDFMRSSGLNKTYNNSFQTPNFPNINRTMNLVLFEAGGCRKLEN